jgi:hypothetical protein
VPESSAAPLRLLWACLPHRARSAPFGAPLGRLVIAAEAPGVDLEQDGDAIPGSFSGRAGTTPAASGGPLPPQGPCSSRGDQSGRSVDSVITTFLTGFFKGTAFVASGRAAWLRCSARARRHQAPGRRAIPSSPAWVADCGHGGDSVAASFRGSPPDPAAASCRWPAPRRDQCPAVARVATPARAGRCPLAPGILSPGKDRRQGARLRRGADAMASATP